MSAAQRLKEKAKTDSAGSVTIFIGPFSGEIVSVEYVKSDYDNGSTFAVSLETTGQVVWNESNVDASTIRAPRQLSHLNTSGAVAEYAAAGSDVLVPIVGAGDRLKIAITSGGSEKSGDFVLTWLDHA